MTLTTALNTVVSGNPYLNNENDVEAVITALDNLRAALSGVDGVEWLQPAPGVTSRQYVNDVSSP
jgi:cellobiose dehydrogenase (acceptor)